MNHSIWKIRKNLINLPALFLTFCIVVEVREANRSIKAVPCFELDPYTVTIWTAVSNQLAYGCRWKEIWIRGTIISKGIESKFGVIRIPVLRNLQRHYNKRNIRLNYSKLKRTYINNKYLYNFTILVPNFCNITSDLW